MARQALPDPWLTETPELCLVCGYALRGLAAPGVCPECGLPFDKQQLVIAGVPNRKAGGSATRRVLWVALFTGFIVEVYTWPLQVYLLTWEVPLVILALLLGAFVALLMTGPRERRGVERFFVTRAGIARLPLKVPPGSKPDSRLVPWVRADTLELRRVSPVWRRVRIGRVGPKGKLGQVVFDAGIRCRDEDEAMVERTVRAFLAEGGAEPGGYARSGKDPTDQACLTGESLVHWAKHAPDSPGRIGARHEETEHNP